VFIKTNVKEENKMFVVNRKEFQKGLMTVSRLVQGLKARERDGVKITALASGKVWLETYSYDAQAKLSVSGKVFKEGEVILPSGLLLEIIGNLRSEEIFFKPIDNGVDLVADSTIYHLAIRNDEFPEFEPITDESDFVIDEEIFKSVLNRIIFCTGKGKLNGVYFNLKSETPAIVATDSERLALEKVYMNPGEGFNALIAKNVLEVLLAAEIYGEIGCKLNNSRVIFRDRNKEADKELIVVASLLGDRYPDYWRVVPGKTSSRIEVDRNILASSLRRIKPIVKDDIRAVRIKIENGEVILKAQSPSGEVTDKLPAKTEGEDVEIIMAIDFIEDFLSYGNWEVEIGLTNENSPVVFKFKGNDNYLYIAMPMEE